ncbi:MAG: hypothetical protein SGPRY_005907, partial [Prymnesium sp.]
GPRVARHDSCEGSADLLIEGAVSAASCLHGLSAQEASALAHLFTRGGCCHAGELPRDSLPSLLAAKLVWYEVRPPRNTPPLPSPPANNRGGAQVPVFDEDRIALPPLQGFVMNRVGHDPIERLLYEVFVSTDEATPVAKLAALLSQPLPRVKLAVSLALRLGFARKLTAPSAQAGDPSCSSWHHSWLLPVEGPAHAPAEAPAADDGGEEEGGERRVGLLVDSQLAASLMMSNQLGPSSLKQHAVSLYEVGKISHEAIPDFLQAADVAHSEGGEVAEFIEHTRALRSLILFLRSHPASTRDPSGRSLRPVDLIRSQSLRALDVNTRDKILRRSYGLLLPMAPMASLEEHTFPQPANLPLDYVGPSSSLLASPWLKLFLYTLTKKGPPCAVIPRGTRLANLPPLLAAHRSLLAAPFGGDASVLNAASALDSLNVMLTTSPLLLAPHYEATNLPLPSSREQAGPFLPPTPRLTPLLASRSLVLCSSIPTSLYVVEVAIGVISSSST